MNLYVYKTKNDVLSVKSRAIVEPEQVEQFGKPTLLIAAKVHSLFETWWPKTLEGIEDFSNVTMASYCQGWLLYLLYHKRDIAPAESLLDGKNHLHLRGDMLRKNLKQKTLGLFEICYLKRDLHLKQVMMLGIATSGFIDAPYLD